MSMRIGQLTVPATALQLKRMDVAQTYTGDALMPVTVPFRMLIQQDI
jgi:hypothetical protein